jgi:hypothetical protein
LATAEAYLRTHCHHAIQGEQVIEPETGSRIGSCVECSVRDRDFSEKKLYKCELCGRWFCEKHVRPRTFLIRGVDDVQDEQIPEGLGLDDVQAERTPEQGTLILGTSVGWIKERVSEIRDRIKFRKVKRKKWKREDSHPDFQYTEKWLEELDIQEKKRNELMKRALGRMNHYYSRERLEAVNLKHAELRGKAESTEKLVTEKHFPTKDIVFLVALLVLAIVFWLLTR